MGRLLLVGAGGSGGGGDVTAPTVTAAAINAAGTQLTITLSESCTGHTGFSVVVAALQAPMTLTYLSGDPGSSYVFTLSRTALASETITLSYTAGNVQDGAGNSLGNFSGTSITNNSTSFNPASLSPAIWLTAGPTWCFKDDAGTQPCASGDVVAVWKDRSGNAFNIVQTDNTKRPTLRLVSGLYYVRGVNGGLVHLEIDASVPAFNEVCGVWTLPTSASGEKGLLEQRNSGGSNPIVALFFDNSTNKLNWRRRNDAGLLVTIASSTAAVAGVNQWSAFNDASNMKLQLNQVEVDSGSAVAGATTVNRTSILGNTPDGSEAIASDMGEFFGFATALSSGNRTSLQTYQKNEFGTP